MLMSGAAERPYDNEEQRREELRARQLVEAHWRSVWRALCDAVWAEVEAFNAYYPDQPSTHCKTASWSDHGFIVRRDASGGVRVVKAFVAPAHAVQLAWVTMAYSRVGRFTRQLELSFAVSETAGVGLMVHGKLNTPAQVAAWLMRPLA
jgi:hypothetical protein